MKHIKKNILLIQSNPVGNSHPSQKKSSPFSPLPPTWMHLISHDLTLDHFPFDSLQKNRHLSLAPFQAEDIAEKKTLPREMDAFIRTVIREIKATQADALLFEVPFQDNAQLLLVLETIHREEPIIMGITRMVQGESNPFALGEEFLFFSTLRMIQWQVPHPEMKLDTRPLWKISKKGIWNHFILPSPFKETTKKTFFPFVLSNPNIAHSFETPPLSAPGKSVFPAPYQTPVGGPMDVPYSNLEPLPGIPLWQVLNHPAHILLYLTRYSQKELFTMRVDPKNGALFSLGRNITYSFEKPDHLPPGYLDEICKMVEAGGSVATKWVRYNLERAFLIAYAMENGVIVGNSSLKNPRSAFIERINKISNMDFTHFLERGYTSVRPEYRALGVGAKLLEGLTARAEDRKIFSIISEDNIATQKIAIRNKTRKVVTYYSEQMGKSAGIWMPESMIDS